MAWLLHEPRLRAEVPVFCIVGLKPLLCMLISLLLLFLFLIFLFYLIK
jgi:hypothetical protein